MGMGFMAGSIVSKMVMDTRKWSNSIKVVKKDEGTLKGMSARLAPKFKKIGMGMTIAGAAIVAGMAKGISAFKDFDLAMIESLAIMGDISEEMQTGMKDAALEMSGNSKFAASELAESYFFLASAGIDAAGAIKALPVVTKFAQAGAFSLTKATDLLTDAQSALGLSSKDAALNQRGMIRVSDVLVMANTLANASVSQFSEALTNRAGPAMRAYGVDLESGVAVLASFADQGIKGSEAGMQYAIVLRDLQKSAMGNKGAFEAAGVAVYDANGNLNNMGDIIGQLEVRLGGMSAEQKKAELTTLGFQERSQLALLTLIGTSDKIKEYEKDLRSAGGITQEVSDKQLKSLSAQLTMAKNNITNAGIALGTQLAPALIDASKWIAKVVGDFVKWTKENPKLFGTLTKIVGGLGLFLSVMGPIVMMAPKIIAGILGMGKAFIFLATNPVALIIAALAALTIGYLKVKKAQDEARKAAERYDEVSGKFEKKLKGIATQAGLTMVEFHKLKEKYKGNINVMALAIKKGEEGIELQKAMNEVGEERVEQQKKEIESNKIILPTIEALIPPIKELKTETKKYTDFLGDLGIKTIKEKGDRSEELEGIIDDLTTAYKNGEISLHDYKAALKAAKDEIEDLGTEIIETAIPAANDMFDLLANAPSKLLDRKLVGFPVKIAEAAKKGATKVKTIWSEMTDGIKTQWGNMWTDFLKGTISLKSFGEAFKKFASTILDQFLGMVGQMIAKWTMGFIQKMIEGTATMAKDVIGSVADVGKAALDVAKGFSPAGMIATTIGTAVGSFLGSLIGPKGPSARSTDLIKDNTWNTNQNVINLHDAMVAQLHEIKLTGWNLWELFKNLPSTIEVGQNLMRVQTNVLKTTELILMESGETLKKIREILDTSPSTAGGNGGGGAGSPMGTQVNINRIQNTVNINGIMISDRDYARERLIPEFLHALKQRSTKKRLQEILGIA